MYALGIYVTFTFYGWSPKYLPLPNTGVFELAWIRNELVTAIFSAFVFSNFSFSANIFNILCISYVWESFYLCMGVDVCVSKWYVCMCSLIRIYVLKVKFLWPTDEGFIMQMLTKTAIHSHIQTHTNTDIVAFMLMEFCILWHNRIKQKFIASLGQGLTVRAPFSVSAGFVLWLPKPMPKGSVIRLTFRGSFVYEHFFGAGEILNLKYESPPVPLVEIHIEEHKTIESIRNSLKERYVDMNVFRGKPSAYVRGLIFLWWYLFCPFSIVSGVPVKFCTFRNNFSYKRSPKGIKYCKYANWRKYFSILLLRVFSNEKFPTHTNTNHCIRMDVCM